MADFDISEIQRDGAFAPPGCSVYSLSYGTIVFNWINGSSSGNLSNTYLPAYYITNCSMSELQSFILSDNFTVMFEESTPLVVHRNSGTSFIALLFVVSGSCVSSWMLCLLLYLSPKFKRKPFSTQLATIFYSIVTTILLSQITNASSKQYYEDTLDIIGIHSSIYSSNSYRITFSFSQFINNIAFLQIGYHLTKLRIRRISAAFASVLVIAYTCAHVIFEVKYEDKFTMESTGNYITWQLIIVIFKLLIMGWVALTLLYYTTVMKNPTLSYSRRVFGLSVLTWVIFVLFIIISILSVTMFKSNWLVKFWIIYTPQILEIFLLTIIWEWIYSISILEKKDEMSGVLGRRISMDDVASISSNIASGGHLSSMRNRYRFKLTRKDRSGEKDRYENNNLTTENSTSNNTRRNFMNRMKRVFSENQAKIISSSDSDFSSGITSISRSNRNISSTRGNTEEYYETGAGRQYEHSIDNSSHHNNANGSNSNNYENTNRGGDRSNSAAESNMHEDLGVPFESDLERRSSYDIGVPIDVLSTSNHSENHTNNSHDADNYSYEISYSD